MVTDELQSSLDVAYEDFCYNYDNFSKENTSHACIKAFGAAMGRSDAKSARAILNEIQALVDFFTKKSQEDNQRFKSKLAIKALVVIIQKMMVSELGSRSNRGDLNTLKLNIEK